MRYQTITEVWHEVLDFLVANQKKFSAPEVTVYSDEISVEYKTKDVIRAIPDGAERWRIYAEDGMVKLCFSWDFDEESNKANTQDI